MGVIFHREQDARKLDRLALLQNCAIYIAMLPYRPIKVILSNIVTIHIRHGLTILGLLLTDPMQLDSDLTQHITDLTLLKITLIWLDIAQNYPYIAGYCPISAI